MSKAQKGNKEDRKKPMLTLKEKRQEKHRKKDVKDAVPVPFLPHR